MKRYSPVEVNVDDQQEGRLKKAIEKGRGVDSFSPYKLT